MSFQNKVVVVTGAASGIGAAIAMSFAKRKASLCIIDINKTSLLKVKQDCEEISDNRVQEIVADISKDENAKNIIELTLKEFEKIDVLVNSAGIFRNGHLQDPDMVNKFDKVMSVNVRATIVLTQKALPALIKSKGSIINIASIAPKRVIQNSLPYIISEGAIICFTKKAAFELAVHGVRMNSISPGPVKTDLLINAGLSQVDSDTVWHDLADRTALKKFVKAEEVAELAVYLASDIAATITGSDFVVDAGALLGNMDTTPGYSVSF